MRPNIKSFEPSAFQFGSSIKLVPLAETFGHALISTDAFTLIEALDPERIIHLYTLWV